MRFNTFEQTTMGKAIRIIAFVFVVLTMQLVSSCFWGKCDSENLNTKAEITGINMITFHHKDQFNRFKDLEFNIHYTLLVLEQVQIQNRVASLLNTAYADDCPPSAFRTFYINPIDSVRVTTDRPYTQAMGNDITGLLVTQQLERLKENMNFSEAQESEIRYDLGLFTPPDKSDTFRFTVQLIDTFGQVFTSTTDPVFILVN